MDLKFSLLIFRQFHGAITRSLKKMFKHIRTTAFWEQFPQNAIRYYIIACQHANACNARCPTVRPSVRHSDIVSKRMQTLLAIWCRHKTSFFKRYRRYQIPQRGVKYTGWKNWKTCDFRPTSSFISEVARDRFMVTMDHHGSTGSHRWPTDPWQFH